MNGDTTTVWHTIDEAELLSSLKTELATGLSDKVVASRQEEIGPNELIDTGTRSPLLILWEQVLQCDDPAAGCRRGSVRAA